MVPHNIVHGGNGTEPGSGQMNNLDGGEIDPREIVAVAMNLSGGNIQAERDLNDQIDEMIPIPDGFLEIAPNLDDNNEIEPLVAPLVEPLFEPFVAPVAENRAQNMVNDVFSGDLPFVLEVNS